MAARRMSDAISNASTQGMMGAALGAVSPSEGITERISTQSTMSKKKRNQVANTPMARAKYADKAPKINLRKSYPE